TTITTRQGKQIEVISQCDLRSPAACGAYVRAYCHIHGSDHQRSLSIQRSSGWGHCFNAACGAVVLVSEWNPAVAAHLLHHREYNDALSIPVFPHVPSLRLPLAMQPVLLYVTEPPQPWQRDELCVLSSLDERMATALDHSQRARRYLAERDIPLLVAL